MRVQGINTLEKKPKTVILLTLKQDDAFITGSCLQTTSLRQNFVYVTK